MFNTSQVNKSITGNDTRTVKQYLEDVAEIERKGKSPAYSNERKRIITYWKNALEKGLVSPEDKMFKAIEKMRQVEKQKLSLRQVNIYR